MNEEIKRAAILGINNLIDRQVMILKKASYEYYNKNTLLKEFVDTVNHANEEILRLEKLKATLE